MNQEWFDKFKYAMNMLTPQNNKDINQFLVDFFSEWKNYRYSRRYT